MHNHLRFPSQDILTPLPAFSPTAGLVLAQVVDPVTAESIVRMIAGIVP